MKKRFLSFGDSDQFNEMQKDDLSSVSVSYFLNSQTDAQNKNINPRSYESNFSDSLGAIDPNMSISASSQQIECFNLDSPPIENMFLNSRSSVNDSKSLGEIRSPRFDDSPGLPKSKSRSVCGSQLTLKMIKCDSFLKQKHNKYQH